jgi:hypothetical protein
MKEVNKNIGTSRKREKLISRIEKDLAINSKDARAILGHRMGVYRLAQRGIIVPIDDAKNLGLFTLPNIGPFEASFAALSKYYPDCVVSGPTCLSIHGLTDDYIGKIHVDIAHPKDLKNDLFSVHRVKRENINNVVNKSFKDQSIIKKIKIYSPERSLHEAYKYFYGTDIFYKAIVRYRKNYLNRASPGAQYDTILKVNPVSGSKTVELLSLGDINE